MNRKYKYYPEDFPELNVKNIHYDLVFDIFDDKTKVNTKISFKLKNDTKKLELDAKKIDINSITSNKEINWEHDKKENKLIIKFKNKTKKGEKILIESKHTIKPSANDLEGLYYDMTPKGAPPQQITQCQQWGFQKLTPCFDYMNAKATYKTKIIANKGYTHLISNGNVLEKGEENQDKKFVTYLNEKVPMAPYLFFLGVGTWKETNRELEYASGKKFILQMLTLENATDDVIKKAIDTLAFGVQWINIFTGAKRHLKIEKRKKIFDLCIQRDTLKLTGEKTEEITKEIQELSNGIVYGYEYTGEVYREIAMQNSNFGGMENVGNTTITANRMLPFKEMSDRVFSYLLNVKTHEFYHNLNGSEVTSHSPFDLWLNEAITEYTTGEEYISFVSSKEYSRLENVSRIVSHGGTFDEDTGALGHTMIPKGFNTPDELIDGITYSKGPELIRMVKIILGEDKFYNAMQKYHEKYSHSNAKTKDWIKTMEDNSGVKINKMVNTWLNQRCYPIIKIKTDFDEKSKRVKIKLKQTGFGKGSAWEFPFSYAIFDLTGKKCFEETKIIKKEEENFEIKQIENIGFFSFNRGLSFYGKVNYDVTENELMKQVEKDDDIIAKHIALYKLIERERTKALKENKINLDEKITDIYFDLLSNKKLMEKLGIEIMAIPGGVEDKYLRHYYNELYNIGRQLRKKIANKYKKELIQLYNECNQNTFKGAYVEKSFKEIKNRSVKNFCLGILSEIETKEIHELIKNQFKNSKNQTDKLVAFSLYIETKANDKDNIIKEFEKESIGNPVQWEQYLSLISRSNAKNTLKQVKRIKKSEAFNIKLPNDQRALLLGFAMNKKKSLLTENGREFLKETMIEVSKLNEYTGNIFLSLFEELNYMKENEISEYVKLLVDLRKELSFEEQPSVFNNIKQILDSSPRAVKKYEESYGKLKL